MSATWGNSEKIYSLGVLPPVTRFGHRHCAHQGGSISPLMIFTTCDVSANSVAAIAKVTLTRLAGDAASCISEVDVDQKRMLSTDINKLFANFGRTTSYSLRSVVNRCQHASRSA